jgi:ATP-binding cassette subfamily B protein
MSSDAQSDGRLPTGPVRRLISYQPRWFLAGAVGWLLFHVWPLIPGLIGKAFFDVLEGHGPPGFTLATVLGLVAAAGLARVAIVFFATMTATRWRFGARSLVQTNMLNRILRRPGPAGHSHDIGRTVSTLRDDAEAISMMGDWTFDAIAAIFFGVSALVILFVVDARVTVLVMVPVMAVVLLAHVSRVKLEQFRQRSRAATAEVTGTIGDIVSAARAIQGAGKEAAVVAHLRRQGDARRHAVLRDELFSAGLDGVFANMASLGAGLVLLVAASAMRDGAFTVGDFVLFSTYLLQVTELTGFIGYLARARRQATVSFQRAATLMRGAPPDDLVAHHRLHLTGPLPVEPVRPRPKPGTPFRELRVTGLTLMFPDSGRGIRDVALRIPRGTLTVVTGRIGAGKSTLLRALLGLQTPQHGSVSWNGKEIASPSTFLIPPRAAYTPQAPALLSATLRDNILLGLNADAELDDAVRRAVLDRDVAAMADGLDTEIGVRGKRLSGGQLLRAATARMLVRQAELLVFDDVSSGLDVETEAELWRRVLADDPTCLVVSHRPALLQRADQIVVMKDGLVVGTGTLPQLLASCEEMTALMAIGVAVGGATAEVSDDDR